jgi:hypothetical protein
MIKKELNFLPYVFLIFVIFFLLKMKNNHNKQVKIKEDNLIIS